MASHGFDVLVAAHLEATRGTAVDCDNGVLISHKSIDLPESYEWTPNDDVLDGYDVTDTIKGRAARDMSMTCEAYYWGWLDRLLGWTFANDDGPDQYNQTDAYHTEFEVIRGTNEVSSLTFTLCADVGADGGGNNGICEMQACQITGFRLEVANSAEAELTVRFYPAEGPEWDSSTNTASTGWSNPWTASTKPSKIHFDDLLNRVWITTQGDGTFSVADAKCFDSFWIDVDFGILTENNSTCGELVGKPNQKFKVMFGGTLSLYEDDTWQDYYDGQTLLKAKVHYVGSTGGEGNMKGDTNPSVDLTLHAGGANVDMNFNIDGDGAQNVEVAKASCDTGSNTAAAFQAAVRDLTAADPDNQAAYDNFTMTYVGAPVTDYYLCTSGGNKGSNSSCLITAGTNNDVADDLKLDVLNGGAQQAGSLDALKFFMPQCKVVLFEKPISGPGLTKCNLEFLAEKGPATAPVGFTTGDDSDLNTDIQAETIRAVIINRNDTTVNA